MNSTTKAVNAIPVTLSTITVANVDMALLKNQTSRCEDILRTKELPLSFAERAALRGVVQLLTVITAYTPRKEIVKIRREDVNRIRDLGKCGKSAGSISQQLGYKPLAVQRLLNKETYAKVKYVPSEFAPPTPKSNGK